MAVLMPITFPSILKSGPTAVARVDGGIGLDEVIVRTGTDHAALRADNARRNRLLQSEGIPDGNDPIADAQSV